MNPENSDSEKDLESDEFKNSRKSTLSSPERLNRTTRNFIDPVDTSLDHDVLKFERSPGPVYDIRKSSDSVLHRSFVATIGKDKRDTLFGKESSGKGPIYSYNIEVLSNHTSNFHATIGKSKNKTFIHFIFFFFNRLI
jgi:hypothetical protein